MADEQIKQELISIFSEAGKGIQFWVEHLSRSELEELSKAAAVVKEIKQRAVRRQQENIR